MKLIMESWREFQKIHKTNEKIYKQYASRLSEESQEVFWGLSEDQKVFVVEDWINQGRPSDHLTESQLKFLNEELLDEGLRDWLKSKSAAAITGIKDGLKKIGQEIKESGEAGKLILKAATGQKLSDKELAFVKRQLQDIGVGTALLAIFFLPGGALGVGAIVKLGKYFGIDILPTAFQESLMSEKWSDSERKKRKDKCANPKGFTMKQFCKNQRSRSKQGQRKN